MRIQAESLAMKTLERLSLKAREELVQSISDRAEVFCNHDLWLELCKEELAEESYLESVSGGVVLSITKWGRFVRDVANDDN